MPLRSNFLLWGHREQDAPEKNKKREQRRMQVRQKLYQRIKYVKKPNRMLGFFMAYNLVLIILTIKDLFRVTN